MKGTLCLKKPTSQSVQHKSDSDSRKFTVLELLSRNVYPVAEVLPDAIKTRCAKCTDVQRDKAIKVVRKLQRDYPQEWKIITDKWDPKGNLMKEFEQELAKTKQG